MPPSSENPISRVVSIYQPNREDTLKFARLNAAIPDKNYRFVAEQVLLVGEPTK